MGDHTEIELIAQTGTSEIMPGVSTKTWGFNGPHLGPTLRLSRGENVAITVKSELPETTAVHWHGMKLPAKADGGPHSPIEPGESWTAEFTVEQPPATLWYHPHPHGKTGVQAYRGLAGMLIIDDELDLPNEYGVDDIPVVIMDANFRDGQLDETFDLDVGLQGKTVYVNGITDPHFDATTSLLRMRLLNGSNMRFHNIGFKNGKTFKQIASDQGLLDEPKEVTSVALGPGERAEIVVEIDGDLELYSLGFEDRLGVPDDEFVPDFLLEEKASLLKINAGELKASKDLPAFAAIEPLQAEKVRTFELNTYEINGKSMDMTRVDEVIDHDEPEIWEVTNANSDWIHNFHIHNARFQVDGAWKATVTIRPGETVRLLVEFGHYPDPHWPYMYHCHMLYHEDQGMMGQYVVVSSGESPDLQTDFLHHH